jgi:hypothetical protein
VLARSLLVQLLIEEALNRRAAEETLSSELS